MNENNEKPLPIETKHGSETYETRYQQLVEFSPEAIIMLQDNDIVYINRAGALLADSEEPNALIGHPIRDFIQPNSWKALVKRLEKFETYTDVWSVEERVTLANGQTRDFELTATTIQHQNRPATQLIVRDISRRKQVEETLQQRNRELFELNHVISMMTSTLSLEEVLQTIVETAPRFCPPSSNATIQLLDTETGYLYTHASTSPLTPEKQQVEFPPGTGLVGVAVGERRTINSLNVLDDPRYLPGPVTPLYRSLLIIPLIIHNQVLGTLSIDNREIGAYTTDIVQQLQVLAQYAAVAIQNAQLYTQAQQEIAQRQQVETALREHQQLLQTQNAELRKLMQAVEQSANITFITDLDGHIEYVNPRFEEATGYSATEVLGKTPRMLKSGEHNVEKYRDLWKTITAGKVWRGELCNRRKDGRLYWEQASIAPAYDENGQMMHFVATKEDITERKAAADALKERLRFEALLSELSAAFVRLPTENIVGEIQKWLQRLAKFLNVEQPLLDQFSPNSADSKSIYSYDPATPSRPLTEVAPNEAASWYWERLKSGKMIILESIADLPTDATTERTYMLEKCIKSHAAIPLVVGDTVLGAIRLSTLQHERTWSADIIQRLRLVSEVFANALMRQRAEEDLHTAMAAADAASRAKSTFLANISHELRTPLNGILGYAQILSQDKTLPERHQDAIHTIQNSGEHLLTLINDILDMSKIEAGKMELTLAEFHLPRFLQNLVNMFQVRAQQKGLDFVYHPPHRLPVGVLGDERRLRQVLINLLGNAVKYTEQGRVTFNVGYDGENLLFRIEDTGPGIQPDELKNIFVPFRQASNRNKMTEGTGLGLPISRNLVELMQSKLHVSSTPGEGSVFWFKLNWPVVDAWNAPAETSDIRIVGYKGPPLKALVVDDNAASRAVGVKILEPLGFEVRDATNGRDAIAQAKAFHPHLVLMDIVMPELDGLQATAQIRAIPELKGLVIVAISASAFMEDQRRCLDAGCNAFLAKPFHHTTLLRTLREHLNLTWNYATEITTHTEEVSEPIVVPDYTELVELYKLALMGKIVDLRTMLDVLNAKDSAYEPFVTEIRTLAQNVRLRDMRKRLKIFLDNAEEPS